MSNLEKDPVELVADCVADADTGGPLEILEPREVPLGGPRAMTVHRTLPQRRRSTIGAWCFIDHYGPDDVSQRAGMQVPPHPHTGLQTVSWLFSGEIEHRDSIGSHAFIEPGELNLMTAGRGIAHSEVSTPRTTILHGAQLWLALPTAVREREPAFENTVPTPFDLGGATVRVFIGSLGGVSASSTVYSQLVGAQLDLPPSTSLDLIVESGFEHGVLLDSGDLTVEGVELPHRHLGYLEPGRALIRLSSAGGARLLLLGGVPLGEQLVMWWNFIGRSHDEVVAYRDAWQREVVGGPDETGPFTSVPGFNAGGLPAPELPTVRLKPRANPS
jgi:redox-sensitive bicupin YhaK (pirin superfamily)